MALTVEVQGLTQATTFFQKMILRLGRPERAFEIMADLLEGHVETTYKTKGQHIGKRHKALRPSTVEARSQRRGYYKRPRRAGVTPRGPATQWTGRGRESFKRGAAGNVRRVSATGLVWGSKDRNVGFNQRGSRNRPKRIILGFRSNRQRLLILREPVTRYLAGQRPEMIRSQLFAELGIAATR